MGQKASRNCATYLTNYAHILTFLCSLSLGFTFSYPVRQDCVDRGKLVTWTKGFDIKGVEGEDVVLQLGQALERQVSGPYIQGCVTHEI